MIGKKILHYKILEKLGEGGMGVVYKAEDTKLKRTVAIKFLPRYISNSEEDRARFRLEAQAAAALNHQNITQIYSIEELDEEIFIVMEFIDGEELKTKLQENTLELEESIDLAVKISRGLSAAHKKGIVHRDIKSSNIMCSVDGRVKIMDFGLAKMQGNSDMTKRGTTLGTTSYMSPEQFRGGNVDERSDIWSMGVLIYEMLSGKMPFSGAYEQAVMYSILNENSMDIRQIKNDIPIRIKEIIDKCLEKDVENRYQSAEELAEDLEDIFSVSGSKKTTEHKFDLYQKINTGIKSKITYGIGATFSLILLIYFSLFSDNNFISNIFYSNSDSEIRSLLILPFTNIGNDPKNQAFCDGLMETLTSKLTELEYHSSLMVVPSSEVRRFDVKSPGEARKSFGVNLAVTGSLQLFDNKIRLNLNLVDAENMRQISSAVIDVSELDFLTLQDNSVLNLVKMLKVEIDDNTKNLIKEGSTSEPEAYEFYLQGLGYLQRYELEENLNTAEDFFHKAIDADPVYALAYSALGETYWRKYELLKDVSYVDLADFLCKKAYSIDPNLAPVNKNLGIIRFGTGNYDDAIKYFNKALDLDPKSADSYRGLAKAYEALDLVDEAEDTYRRALKLKPGYWAGYNDLGVFYFRHGRYEKAIKEFTRVTILTPDNYKGYNNLGGVYYRMEEWQKAREMFEKSFKINKSYSVASNLGTLYYLEGNFKLAIKKYELAIELNNDDYLMWGNLGSAYYWSDSAKEKAENAFNRAIRLAEIKNKINPNNPIILSRLGGYYSMTGNKELTLDYFKKAINLEPDNPEVMYLYAAAKERIGEREEAIKWLHRSIEKGYSKAEISLQPEFQSLLKDKRFDLKFSNN